MWQPSLSYLIAGIFTQTHETKIMLQEGFFSYECCCVIATSSRICGRIFRLVWATLLCCWGLKTQGDTGVFVSQLWIILKPDLVGTPPNRHTRSVLALSSLLFVPLSSPQLCHNIQRTGAHSLGCKHTRGSEVVQQQPRTRDAYELARL